MPGPRPATPLLWPFFVALGVAAAVAVLVVVVASSAASDDEPEPGPLGPLSILVAVAVDDSVVRAVTREGGCRQPLFADVRVRAEAVELRVIGRSPGGPCSADIKIRCNEVRLPAAAASKPLVATPVATGAGRVSEKTLAREHAAGECPRPPLR